MKINLNHCADLGDWYTIVRAEHDHKELREDVSDDSHRFMNSERLSSESYLEGCALEMLGVAAAIKNRGVATFKRVAIHFQADGVHLYSPKNG